MSDVLTRNDVERLLEEIAYPRGTTRPNPTLLLAHDAALRARIAEAETLLRRICAADMTSNDAERNRATGEAAMFLRVRR